MDSVTNNTSEDDAKPIDIVRYSAVSEFFDQVIGHIEDIVLSEDFQVLHEDFLCTHCMKFENDDENKLEYMDVFQEYTNIFEQFFKNKLLERMHNFDMDRFNNELSSRENVQDSLGFEDTEIYELLHSFSNFQTFKELMLDYRMRREGHAQHLELDILVTKPLTLDCNKNNSGLNETN